MQVGIMRKTYSRKTGELLKEERMEPQEEITGTHQALDNHCKLITGKGLEEVIKDIVQINHKKRNQLKEREAV